MRRGSALGEQWPQYNSVSRCRAATTPAAFREQLDGSDKRVPYLNIYECDPFGTSSLNDNIIKTQILIIMQGGLSERFLR